MEFSLDDLNIIKSWFELAESEWQVPKNSFDLVARIDDEIKRRKNETGSK